MNKKAIGCMIAASVMVMPSVILSGCEQNDGLGEYESEYTLSKRMMTMSAETGENPGAADELWVHTGGYPQTIELLDGNPYVTATVNASWPEGLEATTMAHVEITYQSSNERFLVPANPAATSMSLGNSLSVPVIGEVKRVDFTYHDGTIEYDTIPLPFSENVVYSVSTFTKPSN